MSVDWIMRESHSGVSQKIVYAAIHLVHVLPFILLAMAQEVQLCHFVTRPGPPLPPGLCKCRLSASVAVETVLCNLYPLHFTLNIYSKSHSLELRIQVTALHALQSTHPGQNDYTVICNPFLLLSISVPSNQTAAQPPLAKHTTPLPRDQEH